MEASQVALVVENLPANARTTGAVGLILGWGRSPGAGNGNPLQYSCLENPQGQRSLAGYGPKGCKESDTAEQLTFSLKHTLSKQIHKCISYATTQVPQYSTSVQIVSISVIIFF